MQAILLEGFAVRKSICLWVPLRQFGSQLSSEEKPDFPWLLLWTREVVVQRSIQGKFGTFSGESSEPNWRRCSHPQMLFLYCKAFTTTSTHGELIHSRCCVGACTKVADCLCALLALAGASKMQQQNEGVGFRFDAATGLDGFITVQVIQVHH